MTACERYYGGVVFVEAETIAGLLHAASASLLAIRTSTTRLHGQTYDWNTPTLALPVGRATPLLTRRPSRSDPFTRLLDLFGRRID
jgi:hypothetical protein